VLTVGLFAAAASLAGCGDSETDSASPGANADSGATMVVYSGRSENLIKPLIERFTADTGIKAEVRYGGSPELGAQLLEEGRKTKADVFLSQDAGALGAVEKQDLFGALPQTSLDKVDPRYRSDNGKWVGVSGRARVVAYNPAKVPAADLPKTVYDVTNPKWKGRVGIAPTNASFQSFVTAMRVVAGEQRTKQFLVDLKANSPKIYTNNALALDAVDTGQVDLALINHYYLYERQKEKGAATVNARNLFLANGDPGALVNVAGVGILDTSDRRSDAERFVAYLLDASAQKYFRDKTFEFPLIKGESPISDLPALDTIQSPAVDLSDLDTLDRTQALLRESGLI